MNGAGESGGLEEKRYYAKQVYAPTLDTHSIYNTESPYVIVLVSKKRRPHTILHELHGGGGCQCPVQDTRFSVQARLLPDLPELFPTPGGGLNMLSGEAVR